MEQRIKFTEVLTTSTVRPANSFVSNRSFISTTFGTEVGADELRKSRITNLPNNSKKVGLAGNLEFVVVFQTIEIERLSMEVESNRIKIKDFQRQIFNAQNYEVQIRELTEKCFAYERDRGLYEEEIEKLNLICNQLYTELEEIKRKYSEVDLTLKDKFEMEKARNNELLNEIERWKARYMASEKSKAKELDDQRMMMESQRKSMLDRDMRELTIKFQAERGNLENDIRKLREALEYKQREIEQHKQTAQKLEIRIMELQRTELTINELENRLVMVSQEIHRLNDLLKQKQDELEGMRQREYKLQQQLKEQQQWEFENKQLRTNLENRHREIEDWKVRHSKLDDEVAKNRDVSRVNQELSGRLGIAGKEIERLNDTIRIKLEEIDNWKQQLARQQAETNRYRNLEGELRNFENKVASQTVEIERLNGVLKNRLSEIDDWRNKVSKLEITVKNYTVVEKDNNDLQEKLQNNARLIEDFRYKVTRYETEINNLQLVVRKFEESEKKNAALNSHLESLNDQLRRKTQEIDDFRVRYSNLEATMMQYRNMDHKVKEYQQSFAVMTQEIERLNNVVRAKTNELNGFQERCHGLEDQVAYLKSHETKLLESQRIIDTLNITVNEFKRNIQNEQDKARSIDGRARQLESHLFASNQDKERLAGQLKQKSFEYDELRSKFNLLQQESYHLQEIEAAYREAKNQMAAMVGQIERLERVCIELEGHLKKEQEIGADLGCRVIVLSAELDRRNNYAGMNSKELLSMKQTFYSMEKSSREKDSEMLVLQQRIAGLQTQLTFLHGELERYLHAITVNENKAKQLEADISQFMDYARRIQILAAEIDRLTGENKGLEGDISKLRLRYADNIAFEQKHEMTCMSFVLLFAEIESLRGRIAEREADMEVMRKSYLAPIRDINSR